MNRGKACSLVLEKWIKRRARFCSTSLGGGVLPIMAYTGGLRPTGVPFSGLRYMKGGTSLVEVYKRVGRSVICARERAQRADR